MSSKKMHTTIVHFLIKYQMSIGIKNWLLYMMAVNKRTRGVMIDFKKISDVKLPRYGL